MSELMEHTLFELPTYVAEDEKKSLASTAASSPVTMKIPRSICERRRCVVECILRIKRCMFMIFNDAEPGTQSDVVCFSPEEIASDLDVESCPIATVFELYRQFERIEGQMLGDISYNVVTQVSGYISRNQKPRLPHNRLLRVQDAVLSRTDKQLVSVYMLLQVLRALRSELATAVSKIVTVGLENGIIDSNDVQTLINNRYTW